MSEKQLRTNVTTKWLKPFHAVAVENRAGPGTPDVDCTLGWIELKILPKWVRGCDKNPVLLDHYVPAQRIWAKKRSRAGGKVFLLLRVGSKEYLLWEGAVAAKILGRVPRPELIKNCIGYWPNGLNVEEFIKCLK